MMLPSSRFCLFRAKLVWVVWEWPSVEWLGGGGGGWSDILPCTERGGILVDQDWGVWCSNPCCLVWISICSPWGRLECLHTHKWYKFPGTALVLLGLCGQGSIPQPWGCRGKSRFKARRVRLEHGVCMEKNNGTTVRGYRLSLLQLARSKLKFSQKNKRKSSQFPGKTSHMYSLLFFTSFSWHNQGLRIRNVKEFIQH